MTAVPTRSSRLAWALLAAGVLPDLAAALQGSIHSLYYAAIFLFAPLAVLRLWITGEALARAFGRDTGSPARLWGMELLHAVVVILAIHSLQWNILVRTLTPGSERALTMLPYNRGALDWFVVIVWPYAAALFAAWMLARARRSA